MKTNDYLLLTAGAAFSYLFYHQNAGINFLVFDLLFVILVLLRNAQLSRQINWIWMASLTLISGIGILYTSSALALIANTLCLLTLSSISFNSRTSAIFSFLLSVVSVLLAVLSIVDSLFKSPASEQPKNKNLSNFLVTTIVFILSLIFFMIYKSANPLFAANTAWINLDFLSFEWLFFTLVGFVMCYGLLHSKSTPAVLEWEQNQPWSQSPFLKADGERTKIENRVAFGLFIMLNLMLVILNLGDINTLYFDGQLPEGISHSDFVHDGVGNSILSILLATGIIVYISRQASQKSRASKWLMALMFIWILQTLLMLVSTADRNLIYVEAYNLTYKRTGVFVWLALAAIGLFILAIKIFQSKSFWFLVRKNFATWLSILAVSSLLNWDRAITHYNLAHKPLQEIDFRYMLNLSDAVIPDLISIKNDPQFKTLNQQLLLSVEHINYVDELSFKIANYMCSSKPDWQSWDVRDRDITNALKTK